jgi:hypothetical protein
MAGNFSIQITIAIHGVIVILFITTLIFLFKLILVLRISSQVPAKLTIVNKAESIDD